jgi:hypothetical protein
MQSRRRPSRTKNWSNRVRVPAAVLRVAWMEFVGRIPWTLFVTLTFDPRRVYPVDRVRAENEALRWCSLIGWAHRRRVAWLIATERGRSGQWHAHVLLTGVASDMSVIAGMWSLRNGHVDVRPITNAPGAVLYSTKDAALSGELLLSDTLHHYRDRMSDRPVAMLYQPSSDESTQRGV